ncbi:MULTISPECIES: hypothetical protein [Kitasatospora]|uniref:Uncharacterized protein n=1 Tax=Kitasatospora setae (strain ATCC 33774 / DSM 43861 / JCM 3304 / KCC A-0304 / NBRC 14216 / KM-6054) TaxID=452652 RepID=E4N0X6_KITSK|nr:MULTISPECIES: hypothetical protein [Kitasatospora]BAJ31810.1 hypothetical protein KSE_60420 [Kitasatospora setae KM-6054]
MADDTVWIDLDEVDAAAKKIIGLLAELNGPANKLEAAVKQVQASVYGTDLLGKALQGAGSSVGGLAQHQEQVLEGIRTLLRNATAVGENLQSMVARHRANDDAQAAALGVITDTGTMPTDPELASARSAPAGDSVAGPAGGPVSVGVLPVSLPDAPLPDAPPPLAPIGSTDPGVDYHDPDAPTLDYNHPNPLIRPGAGHTGGARPVI